MSRSEKELLNQAVRRNFEEKAVHFTHSMPDMRVFDSEVMLAVDCGLSSDTFNVIIVRRLDAPEKVLERVRYFSDRGFKLAVWYWVDDDALHGVEALVEGGLVHTETNIGMAVDLAAVPFRYTRLEGLAILPAETPEAIRAYGGVISRLFGDIPEGTQIAAYYDQLSTSPAAVEPDLHHYVGWYHGKPVATGALFNGSETAGIYDIVTDEAYRKRGIGSVMFEHLLHAAQNTSHKRAILQASWDGLRIYQQAGFQPTGEVYVFENRGGIERR